MFPLKAQYKRLSGMQECFLNGTKSIYNSAPRILIPPLHRRGFMKNAHIKAEAIKSL